jgi:hypothetical protein
MCAATDPAYEEISVRTSWRSQRLACRYFPVLFEKWSEWRGYGRFYQSPKLSEVENDRERKTCLEKKRQRTRVCETHDASRAFLELQLERNQSKPVMWYQGGLGTNCKFSVAQSMKNAMTTSVLQLKAFQMDDHYTIQGREMYNLMDRLHLWR